MKKHLLFTLFTIFALLSVACFFVGCNNKPSESDEGAPVNIQSIYIDVNKTSFTASNNVLELNASTSVKDYMDKLKSLNLLYFEGSDGQYGFFITQIYSTKAEGNAYWAVFTDLQELDGVKYSDSAYGEVEINGKTLYSASYGVSSLPCVDGYTYAFVLQTY